MTVSIIERAGPRAMPVADRRPDRGPVRAAWQGGRTGLPDRFGLPRLLRLLVAGSIPPLWYEIAVLHYRGSFQSRYMWLPVAYLPLEMAAGFLAAAVDTPATRRLFRALSWGTAALGAFGTAMHLRGVRRQMGGLYEWRYNGLTGPPVAAPPQVAIFGLVGALGAADGARGGSAATCGSSARSANSWWHSRRATTTPRITTPTRSSTPRCCWRQRQRRRGPFRRAARRLEGPLALAAALAGLVGFGFHLKNVRGRTGGFSWQNLFYGAPIVAPLQLSGQGLLGLLAAYFDRGRG